MSLWQEIKEAGPRYAWGFMGGGDKYNIGDSLEEYQRRDAFIANYGFAVPNQEAIEAIAAFAHNDKVLEVGAGSGLWSKLLADQGVYVTATDSYRWNKGRKDIPPNIYLPFERFYPVEQRTATGAVRRYQDHSVLMLIWPSYAERWSSMALRAFQGSKVIYVGEGEGGCTGDDSLHHLLHREWGKVARIAIPQWQYIHDACWLYERKTDFAVSPRLP